MTDEEKLQAIDGKLAVLEKDYQEWRESSQASGNRAEIYQQVGANMVKEKEYQDKKNELERQRAEIIGVSAEVEAYLQSKGDKRKKLDFSKLDVLEGATTVDNSLNPLGGKAL